MGRSPHPVSRLSTPSSHSDLWRISETPRKKRLWFLFRFRCRNQALIWNWSSFFLSRTYSLILSTQQEVDKRKLVKLTQLDCERNQRSDFGNGKETRCSTCTYLKSWTSHCTLGWAILTHSSCESSKKCHHQIHFSQPSSLSDKLFFPQLSPNTGKQYPEYSSLHQKFIDQKLGLVSAKYETTRNHQHRETEHRPISSD